MSRIPQQLTMAVIIGNRGFFPSYTVAEAREQAVALFGRLGIKTIMLDETQTELGGVETRQMPKSVPNCSAPTVMKFTAWLCCCQTSAMKSGGGNPAPVGLERPGAGPCGRGQPDKMGLATRRDSFCGKISCATTCASTASRSP